MAVIITGAASGIGFATAQAFAQKPIGEGPTKLLLVDRDQNGLEKAIEVLKNDGIDAQTFVADLADPDCGKAIVKSAIEHFGGISTVVSNAGAIHAAPLTELTADAFDFMMRVNARATLLLGQAAHPYLAKSRGSIVATASTAANQPTIHLGAYSASKAALVMLVRQMAAEWGPDGIRCNCVSPGPTHTAMTSASYDDPDTRAKRGSDIPLGRVGVPADLAAAIRFLAGPDASHISGVDLRVDGGLNAMVGNSKNSAATNIAKD